MKNNNHSIGKKKERDDKGKLVRTNEVIFSHKLGSFSKL